MSQPSLRQVPTPRAPSARPAAPGPPAVAPDGPGPAARPGPLAGLLVADFSRVLAGPYCTMLLGDLGADVIKVESPGGDDTRRWVPPVTEDGRSTYFLAINRNKRSVALDLRDEGDLALAQELARRADIFVQNFKPGGLTKFGLDYDSVTRRQPGHHLRLDQRLRRGRRQGPARLRPHGPGHVRPDEPDRRPGRAAVPGGHLDVRRHGGPAHGHRDPGRPASPRRPPARASTSRPACWPPRCPAWSTRPAPMSPGEWSRSGWATPTPASPRMNRCPPPTRS